MSMPLLSLNIILYISKGLFRTQTDLGSSLARGECGLKSFPVSYTGWRLLYSPVVPRGLSVLSTSYELNSVVVAKYHRRSGKSRFVPTVATPLGIENQSRKNAL